MADLLPADVQFIHHITLLSVKGTKKATDVVAKTSLAVVLARRRGLPMTRGG
jgi:hypothetical protein